MLRGDEFQIIDIGDAALGHPVFDLGMVLQVYLVMPVGLGREKGMAEVQRILGYDPAFATEVWRTLCGTYFDLSSPEEIDAMTKKIFPYGMLWNVFHRINRISKDNAMLPTMANKLLCGELLPAIEQAQPLDF